MYLPAGWYQPFLGGGHGHHATHPTWAWVTLTWPRRARGGRWGGRRRQPAASRWESPSGCLSWQWAGVLSRLALEQERILNPVLDRVRTADHHQLRSLTGLIRNLSRHARNKDEMCEC